MRLAVFYAVFEVIVFSVNPFCEIAVHYVKRNTQIAQYAYQMLPLYWMHLIFSLYHGCSRPAAVIKKDEADAQRIPGTV